LHPGAGERFHPLVWLLSWPGGSASPGQVARSLLGAAFCIERAAAARGSNKFFYLFTCEYCFSHYIALAGVLLVDLRLLVPGWRGTLLAWLAAVWVANVYMSLFARLRLDIKRERVEISQEEHVAARLASDDDDETARRGRAASLRRPVGHSARPAVERRIIRRGGAPVTRRWHCPCCARSGAPRRRGRPCPLRTGAA
jgi:hypothetical protein